MCECDHKLLVNKVAAIRALGAPKSLAIADTAKLISLHLPGLPVLIFVDQGSYTVSNSTKTTPPGAKVWALGTPTASSSRAMSTGRKRRSDGRRLTNANASIDDGRLITTFDLEEEQQCLRNGPLS